MLNDSRSPPRAALRWPPPVFAACLLFGFATAAKRPSDAWASPLMIRDNRLAHLDGFPSLGRGYNLHDNTMQALCFNEIPASVTTLDFDYSVVEVDEAYFQTEQTGQTGQTESPSDEKQQQQRYLRSFLRRHVADPAPNDTDTDTEPSGAPTSAPWKTYALQISAERYNYVLDEARSTLSESVQRFLKAGHFVTFFRTCGHYYIRSMRSLSSYLGVLQFRSTGDPTTDDAFVDRIEGYLVRFKSSTGGLTASVRDLSFETEATARDLRLFVHAVGLASATSMPLLPISVAELQLAVAGAPHVLRLDGPGIATEIEMIPWFDNPTVNALLGANVEADAQSFKRIHTLEMNARVVTALTGHRDRLDDDIYLAKNCLRTLDEQYPSGDTHADNASERRYNPEATTLRPRVSTDARGAPRAPVTLQTLRAYLKDQLPHGLRERRRRFLYGDDGGSGAISCLAQMRSGDIKTRGFDEIPACAAAMSFAREQDDFLESYCTPIPTTLASGSPP